MATLAEEKARAAVQAELSMFEADRTVRVYALCFCCRPLALDCMLACAAAHCLLKWN